MTARATADDSHVPDEAAPCSRMVPLFRRVDARCCGNIRHRIAWPEPRMAVVLIGTLDTKGVEVAFVRDRLRAAGLDTGHRRRLAGPAGVRAGYPARGSLRGGRDRRPPRSGRPATAARPSPWRPPGSAKVVGRLHAQGKVDGVLGLGGSAGTTIGTAAMRALPFGVPKLMVSTLASGQVQPYVGVRDILMMHSVVDICGLNRIQPRGPRQRRRRDGRHGRGQGRVAASGRTTSRSSPRRCSASRRRASRRPAGMVEAAGLRGARVPRHRHRRADDGGDDRATG